MSTRQQSLTVHDGLIAQGQSKGLSANLKLTRSPLLAALKNAGTTHIYADTASQEELEEILRVDQETILQEIDGNTINQPLMAKVIKQYLEQDNPAKWAQRLQEQGNALSQQALLSLLYSILPACVRMNETDTPFL